MPPVSASGGSASRLSGLPVVPPEGLDRTSQRTLGTNAAARAYTSKPNPTRPPMTMTLSVGPVIALIAGILILVMPRLLNYIVALYLILIGLLGLFTHTGHL